MLESASFLDIDETYFLFMHAFLLKGLGLLHHRK